MAGDSGQAKRRLAEDFGMVFEAAGAPRMAGRIFGWLMVSDPPEQAAEDLAAGLGASRGSISTMTRMLEAAGALERLSLPGRRRTYYRIKPDPWSDMLAAKLRFVTAFRDAADRALEVLADEPAHVRRRLEGMRDAYAFFEREFPKLIERLAREPIGRDAGREIRDD